MLDELVKKDSEWRKIALFFCKNKEDADDLVQEMYIKFANYTKPLNDNYIFFALKHLFIETKRKKKLDLIYDLNNVKEVDHQYCLENDYQKELILNKVEKLPYFERELLKVTQQISQRELARQTNINLRVIQITVKQTKNKLWQEINESKVQGM